VLDLASRHAFARPFVNSGRLSTAIGYPGSQLNTPDQPAQAFRSGVAPGSAAVDAPTGTGWLLQRLGGTFVLLAHGWQGPVPEGVLLLDCAGMHRPAGVLRRYDLKPGSACLLRPDQHVAARWRQPAFADVAAALARAQGH
jgi:3-(3-hydroxy-phenyl)propionate hydroxylase